MRTGCLFALFMYTALVVAYRAWLSDDLDGSATWIVPCVAGAVAFLALGAIKGAWDAYRDLSAVRAAMRGETRRDGARVAAVGRAQAIGDPLEAPFSGAECVLYEYEVIKPGETASDRTQVGLGGARMEPWRVLGAADATTILGFPDLERTPRRRCLTEDAFARGKEFVERTEYVDLSGFKGVRILSEFISLLADDDGVVSKHWMRDPAAKTWFDRDTLLNLFPPPPYVTRDKAWEDEEDEEEEFEERDDVSRDEPGEDFDDSEIDHEENAEHVGHGDVYEPPKPSMVEKLLPLNEEVCVFGIYSEVQRAIIPSISRRNVMVRLMLGTADKIIPSLNKLMGARLVGGSVALLVLNVVVWGGVRLHTQSPERNRNRERLLAEAAQEGDVAEVERWLGLGVYPDKATPNDASLLAVVDDAAVVAALLRHGANPNGMDGSGYTAVMNAARHGRIEILEQLIAAGADLNTRQADYGSTALILAIDAERDGAVDLLRKAGAIDDTVTSANGKHIIYRTVPPAAACVAYIDAIHARDPEKLKLLSAEARPASFDDVDWDLWHNTRPIGATTVDGYANENAATIAVRGMTPRGLPTTWIFQLVRENGEWKISRERWLTNG